MVWPQQLAQTEEIQILFGCFDFLIHYYQISSQWNKFSFEYVIDKSVIQNIEKVGNKKTVLS